MRIVTRRSILMGTAIPLLHHRSAAEVTPEVVRFAAELEPLVKLIEDTPREKCAEIVADQLRRGVSYRQLMAAVFLAGVRNVNPRPPGFALHCVFIIHSSHLIGMEAPAGMRLLPLFHALDHFKASQDRDARATTGDYTMRAIGGKLPDPAAARDELTAGMEAWDQERAERAAAGLARGHRAKEAFDLMWRYGARDYRNIGHKAIFVANASRTLDAIGWQHAEPVLRSLVLGLLDFGKESKVNGYAFDDQCYAGNVQRVRDVFRRLPEGWAGPGSDVAESVLEVLRTGTPDEVCTDIARRLQQGKATASSVWDAIHLASAELNMRTRGSSAITGIHAVTSTNAMHYAWLAASDPQLRFLLLLQGAGWVSQFRTYALSRESNLRSFPITAIEQHAGDGPVDKTLDEIFAAVGGAATGGKEDEAAARVVRIGGDPAARQAFLSAALRHTITKANEVHHYKYLAALLEDVPLVSPRWQPRLLAAIVYYTKGSKDADTPVMKRAQEVLKGLA